MESRDGGGKWRNSVIPRLSVLIAFYFMFFSLPIIPPWPICMIVSWIWDMHS